MHVREKYIGRSSRMERGDVISSFLIECTLVVFPALAFAADFPAVSKFLLDKNTIIIL